MILIAKNACARPQNRAFSCRATPIEYRSVTSRKCCSQNISVLALDPEKAL